MPAGRPAPVGGGHPATPPPTAGPRPAIPAGRPGPAAPGVHAAQATAEPPPKAGGPLRDGGLTRAGTHGRGPLPGLAGASARCPRPGSTPRAPTTSRPRWCSPTGSSPAPRPPGPRASGAACAAGRRSRRCPRLVVLPARPGPGRPGVRAGGRGGRGAGARGGGDPSGGLRGRRPRPGPLLRRRPRGGRPAGPARRRAHPRRVATVGVADGRFAAALAARGGAVVPRGGSRTLPRAVPGGDADRPRPARPAAPARPAHPRRVRRSCRRGTCWPGSARTAPALTGWPAGWTTARSPPGRRCPELAVQTELDPPVERVDTAAFAATRAGGAAARAAGPARPGLHPGGDRGADRARRAADPAVAARGRAHPGGDRGPGALAAGRLAVRLGPGAARPAAAPATRSSARPPGSSCCGWSPTR